MMNVVVGSIAMTWVTRVCRLSQVAVTRLSRRCGHPIRMESAGTDHLKMGCDDEYLMF